MNHKEFLEDNHPFLILKNIPALKKLSNSKRFLAVLLGVLLIIVFACCTNLALKNSKSVNKILISRESTLNSELTKVENINDILEAEILILKNQVKDLSLKKDKKRLKKISKYLADTEVSGPGVEIILRDNHSIFAPVQDERGIIHNTDLLKIVNFLWADGASAISINGERIVFNSHISCVGPTILVNRKRINAPFTINAVGEKLDETKIKNDTFMLSLKLRGIEFDISQRDDILIPAGKYATYME